MDFIGLGLRVGKALLLSLLMYFSLREFNFSPLSSFAFALVPFILGSVNILSGPAYILTAIIFMGAAGSMLLKEKNVNLDTGGAIDLIHSLSESGNAVAKTPASVASAPATAASSAASAPLTKASASKKTGG